uniref:Uncharacterized protein n=1 Tax=Laticauda laticaudata TaxID=8630 RepID=A0A8C5WXW9_LATLA
MAALLGGLVALGSAAGRRLLPVPILSATVVRFASKKSGGSTRNRGGNRTGKRYGFKKFDGKFLNHFTAVFCLLLLTAHQQKQLKKTSIFLLFAIKHGLYRLKGPEAMALEIEESFLFPLFHPLLSLWPS